MTASLLLVLAGASVAALSGLPVVVARRRRSAADRLAAALAVLGSAVGLAGAALAGLGGGGDFAAGWAVPGGSFAVGIDGFSAVFLLPVFGVPGLAAIYGLGYHAPTAGPGRFLRAFQGVLTAGMALLVVARNGLLFLVGWEAMALAAFFLIATEHHRVAARRAAWVYLVATHLGTACLAAAFALIQAPDGSLDWQPAALAALSPATALGVFALALAGFGLKAGLMPLHVWLPAAHANAPSHVSAVLSGVMIKMGAYGLVRVLWLLPPLPVGCGVLVLALGALSALLGVAATLGQTDLKRLLAYSSIENIGIVFLGVGLALVGRALGVEPVVVLGLGGALFHVLNHSLFKPLLFLGAGSVIHATGTRELDLLGGLARRMPWTGATFLVGAAAISGLPLLNGFAGEFVLYLGLFSLVTMPGTWVALLGTSAVAALALVGGLCVVAFVRCSATVFLGRPRSAAAAAAHESPASMTGTALALALSCGLVGLMPWLCAPLLQGAISSVSGARTTLPQLVPFGTLSVIAFGCAAVLGAALSWIRALARRRSAAPPVGTWDCGYVDAGSPRLQYTGSSFAQLGARSLGGLVRERVDALAPLELFPGPRAFARRATEPLLHRVLWPLAHRLADRCSRLRVLQRGRLQVYLLYILVALLLLLAWSAVWPLLPK